MTTTTERPTVLVADDSVFARRWAERLLTDAGHAVTSVAGGHEAYALARASSPDVLVAEEAIAGLSGRELLRVLRAGRDELGVVLLTASADPQVETDALRLGADRFLRKPCSEAALAAAVAGAREAGAARRARRSREARNAGEVRAAADVQEALLPPLVALPGDWVLATGYMPARDAGGDVYDIVLRDPGRLVVVVGDVSGKGVAGALLAAMFQTAVRSALVRGDGPAEALGAAGALLFDGLSRAGRFLTAVVAEIDLATGSLTYADAGHGHHLLLEPGGAERVLPVGGPPIGFLPDAVYADGREGLGPGERLAAFSDGMVEAGGAGDPATARAELAARLAVGADPADLVRAADDADDRTLLVLGRAT
jgi:serine phosphatase RsbU (regulator of sigma subunit)